MRVTAVIIAALVLVTAAGHAEAKRHKKHYRHYVTKSEIARIHGRPGGHRCGYEADPFLYRNGPYGQTPYFDARNFWERVQSGPFDEMTSASAL